MIDCDKNNILEFLELVGRLKHLKRAGWLIRGIEECETVSGHMYRMAMMTFILDPSQEENKLDRVKCLKLSLVHDLAESIVGDITPHDGIDPDEKHKREMLAMEEITKLLPTESGKNLLDLFIEYEEQATPEAKFVKELDVFDLIHQAFEYEKITKKKHSLQEFFDSCNGKIKNTFLKQLVDQLNDNRANFEKEDD